MILFLHFVIISGLIASGYHRNRRNPFIAFYLPGVLLKLASGVILGLIYLHYYAGGDTWNLFFEAIKVKNVAFSSFNNFSNVYLFSNYDDVLGFAYAIEPRSAFMTKILAPLAWATHDNYWLSGLYLSLFSFFGFWVLCQQVYVHLHNRWAVVIPTLFFPSIVFWSSGIIKESVAMGAFAIVMAILTNFYFNCRLTFKKIVLLAISLMLLSQLKYYYMAGTSVIFLALIITNYVMDNKSWSKQFFGFLVALGILTGVASMLHPNFWPSRILEVITGNYYQYLDNGSSLGFIHYPDLEPTVLSFLIYSPKALFVGLVVPLWPITNNPLEYILIVENWLTTLALVVALWRIKISLSTKEIMLILALVIFVAAMAVFLSLSTPNMGTLIRYRIGYQLVLLLLISGSVYAKFKHI